MRKATQKATVIPAPATKVSIVVTRATGDNEWTSVAVVPDLFVAHRLRDAIASAAKELAGVTIEASAKRPAKRRSKQSLPWASEGSNISNKSSRRLRK